jgi:hypothetical protein
MAVTEEVVEKFETLLSLWYPDSLILSFSRARILQRIRMLHLEEPSSLPLAAPTIEMLRSLPILELSSILEGREELEAAMPPWMQTAHRAAGLEAIRREQAAEEARQAASSAIRAETAAAIQAAEMIPHGPEASSPVWAAQEAQELDGESSP